ncbi:hypothetical protein MPH_02936 [Macrophomina phaseolina MS6]|uniref:Uncharacterized protein n=1 Tax=Macrophomina phaseolina (strain MS6) TaxID=1126212 RepID=K2SST8_MACPH|nr:hypothetical protein MPH_02936 [Macrophomina phaseolina MS6]
MGVAAPSPLLYPTGELQGSFCNPTSGNRQRLEEPLRFDTEITPNKNNRYSEPKTTTMRALKTADTSAGQFEDDSHFPIPPFTTSDHQRSMTHSCNAQVYHPTSDGHGTIVREGKYAEDSPDNQYPLCSLGIIPQPS